MRTFMLLGLLICGCSPAAKESARPTEQGSTATPSDSAATPSAAAASEKAASPAATRLLIVSIDVDSLPSFEVEKGKTARHTLKVVRQDYQGELTLEFDVPPDSGLKLEAPPIPSGKDQTVVSITAQPDARGGTVSIRAAAPGFKPAVLVGTEIRPQ